MQIEATLIHHLDGGASIYAWRAMILDTESMEARSDTSIDDYWNMDKLMEQLEEYDGWLELRVDDPDGTWAQGPGQPDYTSADMWLLPAALVVDSDTIAAYDEQYGEGGYVTIVALDE